MFCKTVLKREKTRVTLLPPLKRILFRRHIQRLHKVQYFHLLLFLNEASLSDWKCFPFIISLSFSKFSSRVKILQNDTEFIILRSHYQIGAYEMSFCTIKFSLLRRKYRIFNQDIRSSEKFSFYSNRTEWIIRNSIK